MAPKLKYVAIPADLSEAVTYSPTGTLLLCDVSARSNEVLSFLSRLRRFNMGFFPTEVVDLKAFQVIRQQQKREDSLGGNTNPTAAQGELVTDTFRKARALFEEGYKLRASDIHIRIYLEQWAEILFRIHGSMTHIRRINWEEGRKLCQAIYQSIADVADPTYREGVPQDARIARAADLPDGLTGIRIASGPHAHGSYMVLRLLYEAVEGVSGGLGDRLRHLGYSEQHILSIELMRRRPAGMNIIAGPTGSGKSTTLKHTMESILLTRPDLNLMSVEDPPEYPMAGVVQVPVTNAESQEARAEAFTKTIRLALRSDPDIIMIGEIRDAESARLAIQASMTGHQVWTTLHANDAFNILSRMVDILATQAGNPMNTLADPSILTGVIAQRLIKTLCPHCKIPFRMGHRLIPEDVEGRLIKVMDASDFNSVYLRGQGCTHCRNGIAGRTVVAEVVCPDPKMMDFFRTDGITAARNYWLKEQKGKTFIHHAISKIRDGIVDPVLAEEVVGPLTMDMVFEDGTIEEAEYVSLVRSN